MAMHNAAHTNVVQDAWHLEYTALARDALGQLEPF